MDVKYIPSDWEKMRNGIGDLIGKGRLGKGMIDALNEVSDNLEEAEASIAKYDSDGVISFQHTSQKGKYQNLYEDFEVLYRFTGKVGGIVDRTIDQPFYDDMDAFVEAMRDLSIANYTTKNRLGITETFYATDGLYNSTEVEKAEVSLEDLFSGDNLYAKQMQLEYEEWKKLNPDQNFSGKEYKQEALSGRAFEYKSIRDQQENKEFLVQMGILGATVISAGITFFCPPAGIALLTAIGAASGALEVKSAVTGKDWVSGRELGTGERALRGAFGALDVLPGLGSITKFSSSVRTLSLGKNMGTLGLKSGFKAGFKQEVTHIGDMVKEAGKISVTRLKSAKAAVNDRSNVMLNKAAKGTIKAGRVVDTGATFVKNLIPSRKRLVEMSSTGQKVYMPAENTHAVENKLRGMYNKIGVNLEGGITKGTTETAEKEIKTTQELLKDSTCSSDDLVSYLKNLDLQNVKRGITTNYADHFVRTGKWPSAEEAQIPKNSNVLKSDGSGGIDWSQVPCDGYTTKEVTEYDLLTGEEKKVKEAIKEKYIPEIGEVIDRYGPSNGRYTSPTKNGVYSYDQRSLPYLEDPSKYHQYEVIGDFNNIADYINNCTDIKLKKAIDAQVTKYNGGNYNNLVTYMGEIAPGFDSNGRGIQYELPLKVSWLEKLGLLKEIK